MIKFCSLSSGSKGNTAYIEINGDKYLIDIGNVSLYVETNLKEMGIDPRDIKGIFISHSHRDHIEGLRVFAKRYNPTIYLSEEALKEISRVMILTNYQILTETYFDNFDITLIPTSHDAKGSYGFIFDDREGNSLVYITDTGYINENNLLKLENKKFYYFESNHDIELLMKGPYPYYLKQRILSDKGHLSNETAVYYLNKIIGNNTKAVMLAHLSETNNTEEIALREFNKVLIHHSVSVYVGKQNKRGELIEI